MTNDNVTRAPVYRYITTNLRTDEVLAEIPFQGVSYGRTLKSSGSFTGNIPVIAQTESMNLFESTTPGKTALYVLRDGECVWGGIVWDNRYDGSAKTLTVSASEFPSYFNRRVIWRDFDLSHKASVVVNASTDTAEVLITDGSVTDGFVPSSEIHLEFNNEIHKGFSGFYRITPDSTANPALTTVFRYFSHDVIDMVHRDGLLDLHTRYDHHFKVGDLIQLRADDLFEEAEAVVGEWKIVSVDKLDSTRLVLSGPPGSTEFPAWTEGQLLVYRVIPAGVYENVTVSTHANTYDFVRYMIESAMSDFSTGVFRETQDSFLGVRGFLEIDQVESSPPDGIWPGWARFRTISPVTLTAGQTVKIRGVGYGYDGDHYVSRILGPNSFEVLGYGWAENFFYVDRRDTRFTSVRIDGSRESEIDGLPKIMGEVTATTEQPHNMSVGDTIEVSSSASDNRTSREVFNGAYQVTGVSGPNELTYGIYTDVGDLPKTNLTPPTLTWQGTQYPIVSVQNDGTQTTISYGGYNEDIPNGATGITFSSLDLSVPIQDISYDKQQGKVWVETSTAHPFATNDTISISGAQATHRIWSVNAVDPNVAEVYFVDSLNFAARDVVTFDGLLDACRIESRRGVGGKWELTLDRLPWFAADKPLLITDLYDTLKITKTQMEPGRVEFTTSDPGHTIPVGAKIDIDMPYARVIQSFQIDNAQAVFRTGSPHNFVAGSKAVLAKPSNMPGLEGEYTIKRVTDLEIFVSIDKVADEKLKERRTLPQTPLTGGWLVSDKHPGGDGAEVVEVGLNTIVVATPQARNEELLENRTGTITGLSWLNGEREISAISGRTVTLALEEVIGNHAKYTYPTPKDWDQNQVFEFANNKIGRVRAPSILNGQRTVISRKDEYTIRVAMSLPREDGLNNRSLQSGAVSLPSRFNGSHQITVHSPTEFYWASTAYEYSMSERGAGISARASLPLSALLAGAVTSADPTKKTISYTKARPPVNEFYPFGLILGQVRPGADYGTYGPYPQAGNLHFIFDEYGMSTARKVAPKYQGFQLTKVGKALSDYTSDLQGFDYRVDIDYVEETNEFNKRIVFIDNEFPDPPVAGELSPISRFGADKVVFEHPGNISKYTLEQNASDAATRMFMVGRNPWGTTKPAPTSAAVAADMLQQDWPLLDADAKNASTYDHTVLYGYAKRDLSESRPPKSDIKISVNGSLEPEIGTYAPGDWCSIIINDDPYIKQWMNSDQEPRDTVVLRRIDGYKVKVPDGVAFPEIVDLDLTPQWEVDRLGD